jgi:hypothetical protein
VSTPNDQYRTRSGGFTEPGVSKTQADHFFKYRSKQHLPLRSALRKPTPAFKVSDIQPEPGGGGRPRPGL